MDKRINTIVKSKIWFFSIAVLLSVIGINTSANEVNNSTKRVPAEWENQEAIWMQWPGYWAAGGGVHCHTNDQPANPQKALKNIL